MTWRRRRRASVRGVAAVVLCAAALAGAAAGRAGAAERFVLEPTEMRREIGLAWYVALPPSWQAGSDDVDHPQRSRVVLLEDGRPLGPAHAVHATIREQGHGAFSHWLDQIYFSSSDGSDPRSNGREYVVELRDGPDGAQSTHQRTGGAATGDGGSSGGSAAAGASTRE